jgi:hypothetical protein
MNNNGKCSVEKICDGVHYGFTDYFNCESVQSMKIAESQLFCVILRHCDRILTVFTKAFAKSCGFLSLSLI